MNSRNTLVSCEYDVLNANDVINNDAIDKVDVTNDIAESDVVTNDIIDKVVVTNDITESDVVTNDVIDKVDVTNDITKNDVIKNDVIAAIATPPGRGALGAVRLSGDGAVDVVRRIFSPAGKKHSTGGVPVWKPRSHYMEYGTIFSGEDAIDEVMLCAMLAPRSFTREDVVEIYAHGGAMTLHGVLKAALDNGARQAKPGEFTQRAFLNGRINLTQAEAVMDLIHAGSEAARAAGLRQLGGGLSARINTCRDTILRWLAHISLSIDYPEHEEEAANRAIIVTEGRALLADMYALLQTAEVGRILREGIKTAIVGAPNAGKSTLLNAILGEDRAITHEQPGTTRDVLIETVQIGNVPLVLMDTAGLRNSDDPVERMGVERSLAVIRDAELVLYIIDGAEVPPSNKEEALPSGATGTEGAEAYREAGSERDALTRILGMIGFEREVPVSVSQASPTVALTRSCAANPQNPLDALTLSLPASRYASAPSVPVAPLDSVSSLFEGFDASLLYEGRKCIVVVNKCDLPGTTARAEQWEVALRGAREDIPMVANSNWTGEGASIITRSTQTEDGLSIIARSTQMGEGLPVVALSAKTGEGLDRLFAAIEEVAFSESIMGGKTFNPSDFAETDIITRQRHQILLKEAIGHLEDAVVEFDAGVTEDMIAIGLRSAYLALGHILGVEYADDIVDRIFAEFCVGK